MCGRRDDLDPRWTAPNPRRTPGRARHYPRLLRPKDAVEVLARGLITRRSVAGTHISDGNDLVAKFLGAEDTEKRWGTDRLSLYVTAHPLKAQHVALAVILIGQESVTNRDTWRHVSHHAADYLEAIARWGYVLSDVEQLVVDTAAASPCR